MTNEVLELETKLKTVEAQRDTLARIVLRVRDHLFALHFPADLGNSLLVASLVAEAGPALDGPLAELARAQEHELTRARERAEMAERDLAEIHRWLGSQADAPAGAQCAIVAIAALRIERDELHVARDAHMKRADLAEARLRTAEHAATSRMEAAEFRHATSTNHIGTFMRLMQPPMRKAVARLLREAVSSLDVRPESLAALAIHFGPGAASDILVYTLAAIAAARRSYPNPGEPSQLVAMAEALEAEA